MGKPVMGQMMWEPVGMGEVSPSEIATKIAPESTHKAQLWRCTDGNLWAEEVRSPPVDHKDAVKLVLYLQDNGYRAVVACPSMDYEAVLSWNPRLQYNLLPAKLPPSVKKARPIKVKAA